MKYFSALFLSFFATIIFAQAPSCPNNLVYIHSGSNILFQTLPSGAAGTVMNNLPAGSGGLAVGPNFGFPAPNPTYWTTAGSTYWYYNGAGWTNTGHNTGNGAAVNIGAGGGFMYNLVGGSGQVYVYNGTGNGTLLVTIPTFGGGGPYDICCDNYGNFFIMKTNGPQGLYMYGPNGVLKCSWTLANAPLTSAGGGFAVIGSTVYYHNGTFRAGNIIPGNSTITFTTQPAIASPSDFASCPIPVPTSTILAPNGGTLSCSVTQLNLIAQIVPGGVAYNSGTAPSSSLATCNFTWSGPGIIAGQGTATITVNQPGVYSFTTCAGGVCPSYSLSNSYTVVGQGAVITPTLNAPTCVNGAGQITVLPNTATNTIMWAGPGIISGQGTPTIGINASGIYSVSITNTVNACAGTGTVLVNQTPTITISLSSNTLCSQGFNGSANSITVSATGAASYTWTSNAGANFTPNNSGGPFNFPSAGVPPPGSYTLGVTGTNGPCSNTANSSFVVLPNPVLTVSSGSMCSGTSVSLTASGASTYTWLPGTNLNTTTGSSVIASPPQTTVYSVIGTSVGCNSSTWNTMVTVAPNPTVMLAPLNPTICAGSSINLSASGANSYNWSPSTGLSSTNGSNVSANPSATQEYTVIGTTSTCTDVAVITVSVIPVPDLITSSSVNTICAGYSANLTVTGATSYTWSPAAGLSTATGGFVVASPSVTTVYTIIGNNGACTAVETLPVYIVSLPDVSLSSPNQYICKGSSTTINASGAQNFTWSPAGSLSNSTGNLVTATPSISTTYTVVAYNTLGQVTCSQLHAYPIVVVPNAEANVSPNAIICLGDETQLTVSGGDTYTWSPSEGLNNSLGAVVIASPSTTSIYTVNSSYQGNCGTSSTVMVTVNPLPVVYAGRDTTFNLDAYKSIKATGTGTLNWTAGDEIWCRVCPETQIKPTRSGCYTIMAENQFGCMASDEVCVTVTEDWGVYIPNAITPNGDGKNDVFYVYGFSITDVHITIFNRWGEKMFTSPDQTVGWSGTFKGVDCPNDVYVYKVDYKALDGKRYHKTGHVTLNK